MANLLIIELPGGNDTDILEAALRKQHSFVFLTQDLSVYKRNSNVFAWVEKASEIIELTSFGYDSIEEAVLHSNEKKKIDALLCLIDIRLIEASKLAKRLGVRHLNVESSILLRDKFSVRERLKQRGIEQPEFALACTNDEILKAIQKVGFPLLMKPSDGYGSQNILTLKNEEDLDLVKESLLTLLPITADYGLGVRSNDRLLVERFMSGSFIGCDTFTLNGKHQLLGINEKLMFSPPSFAIRGGCFLPNEGHWIGLEDYVFSILDAVGFDCGATHIELMITEEGPRVVEINPRLVGAKIARLIGYSLNLSIHEALIDVHLGNGMLSDLNSEDMKPSVTRWLITETAGELDQIQLPQWSDDGVKCAEILSQKGDAVSYPFENAQRLGYVMTTCPTRAEAEELAERFIKDSKVLLNTNQIHIQV